ncbi:sterol-sensing domain of SREBP cleavage-activation-domain-containing protein [Blastocladiella britannica]|nr:sterol-sensing domain of SREBP cleavage-activation-domain-containing protein [Blastocladiella britannica]
MGGKEVVTGVDYFVGNRFAQGFFDSCKDIKFGPDNRFAMDFIGGGARTARDFLTFMGAPKAEIGGSPFPILFPPPADALPGITPLNTAAIPCNSTESSLRCSCVDCAPICPTLPPTLPAPPAAPIGCGGSLLSRWTCNGIIGAALAGALLFLWFAIAGGRLAVRAVRAKHRQRQAFLSTRILPDSAADAVASDSDPLLGPGSPHALIDAEQGRGDMSEGYASGDDDSDAALGLHEHADLPSPGGDRPGSPPLRVHIRHTAVPTPTSSIPGLMYHVGLTVATWPIASLFFALAVAGACIAGLAVRPLVITTDPLGLWVPPSAPAMASKHHYDATLGPFYRTQQVIVTAANASTTVLTVSTLQALFELQRELRDEGTFNGISLRDVCLHPVPTIAPPAGCVVQSVTGYWQDDVAKFEQQVAAGTWSTHLARCLANPAQTVCLPLYGQPIRPEMIMDATTVAKMTLSHAPPLQSAPDVLPRAEALIVTYVNRNAESNGDLINTTLLAHALEWETWFRSIMAREVAKVASQPNASIRLAYSTESSIETEVARATSADGFIVLLSYVAMVAYIIATLRSPTVGLTAVIIVALAVMMAAGIMAWAGVAASFILLEVLPFLALAIGVDNVFLIVEAMHTVTAFPTTPVRLARTMAAQGPGLLLALGCEILVFLAASLVDIPAVTSFALFSATAVACLFFLQCTVLVSLLARVHVPAVHHKRTAWRSYARLLVRRQRWLLATTVLGSVAATLLLSNVRLGLDQRDAVPSDSHLVPYFTALDEHFHVGPPVYYMVGGVTIATNEADTEATVSDILSMCARFSDCRNASVPAILEQERKRQDLSFLASPPTTWADDFAYWLRPNPSLEDDDDPFAAPSCCSIKRGTQQFCDPAADTVDDCDPCVSSWSATSMRQIIKAILHAQAPADEHLPPSFPTLRDVLSQWLRAPPSAECPQAGAAYADLVSSDLSTFAFRVASVPLGSQSDLIRGMQAHQRVAETVRSLLAATGQRVVEMSGPSDALSVDVYSVFHPFFAQYIGLTTTTWKLLAFAHMLVLAAAIAMFESVRPAVLLVVAMAVMQLWLAALALGVFGVPLNGVSVVNLVMATGLGVEFCVHVLRAYATVDPGAAAREYRAKLRHHGLDAGLWNPQAELRAIVLKRALASAGATVMSGIGWTKLVGVAVLAFASSAIFRTYYFLLYSLVLVTGLAVGLFVLPLLLLAAGGVPAGVVAATDRPASPPAAALAE